MLFYLALFQTFSLVLHIRLGVRVRHTALKCFTASLEFFGPLKSTTPSPVGAFNANWSNVKHSPPALTILARAVAVNLNAKYTINFLYFKHLTAVRDGADNDATFPSLPFINFASLDNDNGGRFVLDMNNLFNTVWLNLESVLLARKR